MDESSKKSAPNCALSEQQQELQAVLDAVPTAIICVDDDGRVTNANSRARTRFGVTVGTPATEVLGRLRTPDGEPVSPANHPVSQAMDGPTDGNQYRLTTTDGAEVSVVIEGKPIYADGMVTGAVVSIKDTAPSAAQSKEDSREQELLAHSPDLTFVLDADGFVRYQSPIPERGITFEPRDFAGEKPTAYLHPSDRERVLADFERLLQRGPGHVITTEFRLRDGSDSYHRFENRAINYLGTDPIDGVLVVSRPVDDGTQSNLQGQTEETMLEQLQTTTQQLLETTDLKEAATTALSGIEEELAFDIAGIWLANDDHSRLEPVALSDRRQELIDSQPVYSSEGDSLSWDAFETATPKRIDDLTTQPGRYNTETPLRSELIVPIGDYGVINVSSTTPASFSDYDLRRLRVWSSTVESAFARLKQIRHLRDREAALETERNRLDDFAEVISHDLQNPLNTATGYLGLARSNCECEHLEPIDTALDRMENIIDDTLTLAREGLTVDECEAVALSPLIESCVAVTDATPATVDIETDCTIMGDPERLAHVFENLCQNAVDHAGPEVTVTIGTMADGFYVADDGPGIPPEDRETVFEPGYTTRKGGTGLGLRIVQRIVDAHGWEISVTNSESGGARFEITEVQGESLALQRGDESDSP